jgi:hypothetical protein
MNYKQKYDLFLKKIKELAQLENELLNPEEKELSFGERKIKQAISRFSSLEKDLNKVKYE